MEFELIPVDSIPDYLNVYCGFDYDNHNHLPIIWRYTNRTSYSGWADWKRKYGMVNFYHLYNAYFHVDIGELISINREKRYEFFIDSFLRIYYHEFMHLFFHFRLKKVYFKDKMIRLDQNEKVIDLLAIMLYENEKEHIRNWANEMFKSEFENGVFQ